MDHEDRQEENRSEESQVMAEPAKPVELGIDDVFDDSEPTEPTLDDFFESAGPPTRTSGEKAVMASRGAVSGIVETAPVVAGALAGAKLGLAAGGLGGPLAPVTVPVGGLLGTIAGGAAGYFAGQEIRKQLAVVKIPGTEENFTFESMESVPPDLRPYAVAGETFGASLPFIGAPYLLHAGGMRFSPHLVGRVFNRIIDSAVQYPKSFIAAEISSALGAGIGGGVAEKVYPGQVGPRIGAELVGGFLTPTRWAVTATRTGMQGFRKLTSTFSATSRQGRAAAVIQDIVRKAGENPMQIAARIKQAREQFTDLDLTSAQLADSPALVALEAELVRDSAHFGSEARQAAEASLGTLRTMIGVLERAGDPLAFRQAAQMRADYFQTLLARRLQIAEGRALEGAALIDSSDAKSLARYGQTVDEIMGEALGKARQTEKELWGKVTRNIEIDPEGLLAKYDELRLERLPEEAFPSVAAGFIARIKKLLGREDIETADVLGKLVGPYGQEVEQIKQVTSGELIRFRSRALALARESAAKNEWSDARIYGELAEAALDDLAKIDDPAMDVARTWSRQLHDTFTRTFAGETQEVGRKGAPRIPPEIVMKRALSGGVEAGALHFRQLEEASRMAGIEHTSRMIQLQEQTIRFAAAKTIDPLTGRVNPKRLATFTRDNAELLDRFPEVRDQLNDATTAETLLRRPETGNKRARQRIEGAAAFSKVLQGEDPAVAVGQVLRGKNVNQDFAQLVKLAEKGGQAAKDGLASSVYEYAYRQATSQTGDFSFTLYRQVFESPVGPGKANLLDLMAFSGLSKKEDVDLLRNVLFRASHIEETLKARRSLDPILSEENVLFDAVLRLAGASIGRALPTGGAHPLIVAGVGSRAARQVFYKIPTARTRDVVIEASRNPQFMMKLLQKAKTPKERLNLALQLNAFVYQMGVTVRPGEQQQTPTLLDQYYE